MKNILLGILCFLVTNAAMGKTYGTLILPIPAEKLQDEIIKMDVLSIIKEKGHDRLDEYKTKRNGYIIINNYQLSSWSFYVRFAEKLKKNEKSKNDIYCPLNKPFIEGMSYFHVKYMIDFTSDALSPINKEILSAFGGQSISCIVKSYISKDRLRNYLRMSFYSDTHKTDLIFIIKSSEFYNCVQLN